MTEVEWTHIRNKQLHDMQFRNKCAYCGSSEGELTYEWAESPGETVFFFRCSKCGKVTAAEKLLIATAIGEVKE